MMSLLNPALPATGQTRPPSLHGIRIALVLALLAAVTCWFFMHAAETRADELHPDALKGVPDPTSISVLLVAIPLTPYLLSLLLLSTRRAGLIAAGAGIAGGLFVWFLMLSKGMSMGLFLAFGLSQAPYFLPTAASLLAFFLMGVWVVISALWIGKTNWIVFLVAASATWIGAVYSLGSLKTAQYEFHRQYEQQKQADAFYQNRPRPVGARQKLVYLASCLFQNRFAHPEYSYPRMIDPEMRWFCDTTFAANAVPDFKLGYTPRTDPITGYVVDFQLVAVPKTKGVANRNPLMIDRRGIVFVMYPWAENVPPRIMAAPGDREYSQIDALKTHIERYMQNKNGGVAPAVLTAEIVGALPHETPALDSSGTYMETRTFAYLYLAPKPEAPSRFALSVHCLSYAQNCLRSYYLDYEGVVHGTGEPRMATAEDPPALDCEIIPTECRDVSWFVR